MKAIFLALTGSLMAASAAYAEVGTPAPREQALDLIVSYHDAAPATAAEVTIPGLRGFHRLDRLPGERAVLKFATATSLQAALAQLRTDPDVASVEVADVATAAFVPNDPLYPQQYDKILMNAAEAWDIELGASDVLIAVVDSVATCTAQPDLAPNCREDLAQDFNGGSTICEHGYHVAGIAAASINNEIAIAGVAGRANIVPLRFLGGTCSGSTADALRAWNYVMELVDLGFKVVINNSWGSQGFSQGHQLSLDALTAAGVLSVAAAGNGGSDGVGDNLCSAPVYPVSYAGVLGVAASNEVDALTPFSNFGVCVNGAEVAAPGANILSTCAGATTCIKNGTSMAAPQVAGLAALMLSIDPDLTPAEIATRIMAEVVPIPSMTDKILSGGRIDLPGPLGEPEPGIRVSVICPVTDVNQLETLTCDVTASGQGGFEGEVDLSCGGVPDATCAITPVVVTTGETAELALTPSATTPVGNHLLEVDAVSDIDTATATVQVEVLPEGTITVSYESTEQATLGKPPGCFRCPAVTLVETDIEVTDDLDLLLVSVSVDMTEFFASSWWTLISAEGTELVLRTPFSQGPDTFVTHAFDDEASAGTWTLRVQAAGTSTRATLEGWTLELKGPPV